MGSPLPAVLTAHDLFAWHVDVCANPTRALLEGFSLTAKDADEKAILSKLAEDMRPGKWVLT